MKIMCVQILAIFAMLTNYKFAKISSLKVVQLACNHT